jgi:hypothetical protein
MSEQDQDLVELAMQIVEQERHPELFVEKVRGQLTAASPPTPSDSFPDLQHRAPAKEPKTANELAAMILSDLSNVEGCPRAGLTVTVYGLSPWNAWLHFGAAAGPVPNKKELQDFCTLLSERMRLRYDVV